MATTVRHLSESRPPGYDTPDMSTSDVLEVSPSDLQDDIADSWTVEIETDTLDPGAPVLVVAHHTKRIMRVVLARDLPARDLAAGAAIAALDIEATVGPPAATAMLDAVRLRLLEQEPPTAADFRNVSPAELPDSGRNTPSFRALVEEYDIRVVLVDARLLPSGPIELIMSGGRGRQLQIMALDSITDADLERYGLLAISAWFHAKPGDFRCADGALLVPVAKGMGGGGR